MKFAFGWPCFHPLVWGLGSSISNACLNPGGPVTCYGLHVAAAASLSLLRYAMVPFRRRDNKSSYWYLKQIPSHNRCCAFFLHPTTACNQQPFNGKLEKETHCKCVAGIIPLIDVRCVCSVLAGRLYLRAESHMFASFSPSTQELTVWSLKSLKSWNWLECVSLSNRMN